MVKREFLLGERCGWGGEKEGINCCEGKVDVLRYLLYRCFSNYVGNLSSIYPYEMCYYKVIIN